MEERNEINDEMRFGIRSFSRGIKIMVAEEIV